MDGKGIREETISASRFKARCLKLLDSVAASGVPLTITKRGKPVARVVPVEPPDSLLGSVTFLVSDEELIAPMDDDVWDVERD